MDYFRDLFDGVYQTEFDPSTHELVFLGNGGSEIDSFQLSADAVILDEINLFSDAQAHYIYTQRPGDMPQAYFSLANNPYELFPLFSDGILPGYSSVYQAHGENNVIFANNGGELGFQLYDLSGMAISDPVFDWFYPVALPNDLPPVNPFGVSFGSEPGPADIDLPDNSYIAFNQENQHNILTVLLLLLATLLNGMFLLVGTTIHIFSTDIGLSQHNWSGRKFYF